MDADMSSPLTTCERTLVPYQVEFLIFLCTRPWEAMKDNFSMDAPMWKETLHWADTNGLLDRSEGDPRASEKAQAWLDAICTCPMPTQKWVIEWNS